MDFCFENHKPTNENHVDSCCQSVSEINNPISYKMPLRVTFDSNVIIKVLRPDDEKIAGAPDIHDQQVVHEAICSGKIEGFVAKTFFTKEAIAKNARESVLRSVFRRYKTVGTPSIVSMPSNNPPMRNVPHSPETPPKAMLRSKVLALMRKYRVRILHTYLCGDVSTLPAKGEGDFRIDQILPEDFLIVDDKSILIRNDECFRFIKETLDAGVLSVDWLDSKDGKRSLQEAKHDLRFKNPSAEEADVQMIATHYAHGINVLCTEDQGKGSGEFSVMRPQNKAALRNRFGIRFCTLHELAELITQTVA